MEVQELINNGWRYIKYKGIDFTNMYLINEYGDVLSLNYRGKRGSIHPLTYYINRKGYKVYRLNYKGTSYMAFSHRLVAEMFIPNPDRLPQVNHKDENKLNNHYSNLEWCNPKYNSNYGTRNERLSYANTGHKHSKTSKEKIRQASLDRGNIPVVQLDNEGHLIREWKSASYAARQLGIANHICDCCKGCRESCGGYIWKYSKDYYE